MAKLTVSTASRLSPFLHGLWVAALVACLSPLAAKGAGGASASGPDPLAGPPDSRPVAPDLDSQVILITGSTGGLGREVALELAGRGAHIIVHGRNEERGMEVVEEIRSEGIGSATFHPADLASFEEVRAFGETILREYDRLDVLVNNAGIWLDAEERVLSEDGHELHFQVNYLSTFLLTRMLLPLLEASAPARIVNVASVAQTPLDFDDLSMEAGYSDSRAYAQSKLAQVLFTYDLAEELEGTGISVNALHPATMMDTGMVLSRGAEPRSSVDEGREAVVHLVTAPDTGSGRYFNGTQPAEADPQAYDAGARETLRRMSAEFTGL